MTNKLKAIILLIALVLGGIFISNIPSSDNKYKKKYNELKTQISELSNYNNSLKDQNKIYESQIGDLTTENNTKDATIEELQSKVKELEAEIEANKRVTDLLNTTWILNDTISAPAGYGYYNLGYTAYKNDEICHYNGSWSVLAIGYIIMPGDDGALYSFTEQADTIGTGSSFLIHTNDSKVIDTIIIEESCTSTTLIDWLYANATLVK